MNRPPPPDAAMNRLDAELDRLYLRGLVFAQEDAQTVSLVDARGRVRALILEVVQPVGWDALSEVWHGIQVELQLPAPAIAVSGRDGLQLWLSLESAMPADAAHAFLQALVARFLPHVAASRVRLWPTAAQPARHAALVPALQDDGANWSAFVSPDLVSVFSETPWLDVEPGEEGQAALLRGLQSIEPAAFDEASAGMRASAPQAREPLPAPGHASGAPAAGETPGDDPRRFLLRVMNDERADLALRIEAAKALLK
jgi:hypothetical protein